MVLKATVEMKPYGNTEVIPIPKSVREDSNCPIKTGDKLTLEVVANGFLITKKEKTL